MTSPQARNGHDDEPAGDASASGRREVLKGLGVVAALAVFSRAKLSSELNTVGIATAGGTSFIRPPGAIAEREFVQRCIRCHKCGENCPAGCIRFVGPEGTPETRGTPYIVPRERACILCQRCNNGCPSGALKPVDPSTPVLWDEVQMGVAEVDENVCHSFHGYLCGICIRACPLEGVALTAGPWETPIVDPSRCVGCGLCEQACVQMPQAMRIRPAARGGSHGLVG